jgi:MFS family permease
MSGRHTLYATAFLRALATGMMGVLLGIYLARMSFTAAGIGLVISAGLAGTALATLLVTFAGDRLGRRRLLFWMALASAAGGVGATLFSGVAAVGMTAFIGMINGNGAGPWRPAGLGAGDNPCHGRSRTAHPCLRLVQPVAGHRPWGGWAWWKWMCPRASLT